MSATALEQLTTADLLDEYEHTVRAKHYNPMCSNEPQFSVADLRAEVKRRMAEFEKRNAL